VLRVGQLESGEEGEVARCSVEDGRPQSGVAVKKGTWLLLGWLLTNEETGRGRRGLAAVTHGGEGGVRRSVAAAADRQRPGAGGRMGRVGGHPKQGMPGWLPGGVSSTVLGD
jgi:hypothetical protein